MITRPPVSPVARLPLTQRATRVGRMAALRAMFVLLDLVAPGAGARRAAHLWTTLPGNSGRRKDFRPSAGTVTWLAAPRAGAEVVVEEWGEAGRPTVYLVHGWGGWRGQMGAFVEPLLEQGFRVVAFDAPSHGDATPGVLGPGHGALPEVEEAFEVVSAAHGPAAGVIAHSMGCTTAALVVRSGLAVERLVLIAPNADIVDITHQFKNALGFGERTRGRLQRVLEDFTGRAVTDYDLAPMGADGSMPATLVVHDRQDKETAFRFGAEVADAWPTAELAATDGLGHQRILLDDGVVARAVEFVAAPRAL